MANFSPMQPILSVAAPETGMLFLNGRFAGEVSRDALLMPIAPSGALYLEYRPFTDAIRPMARRLVFSMGALLPESVPEGVYAVRWPTGVTEIELAPPRAAIAETRAPLPVEGLALCRSEAVTLEIRGTRHTLPDGAETPNLIERENALLLRGACASGEYLVCLDRDTLAMRGLIAADSFDLDRETGVLALVRINDLVGHASLEHWRIDESGLSLADSEPVWADGHPHWPETAEQTALAALEAAAAGASAEADGYLAPNLRGRGLLANAIGDARQFVPLKFAPPDARASVGAFRRENPRCAVIEPIAYRAEPFAGAQGAWRLTALART